MLRDNRCSRKHAEIVVDEQGVFLRNLNRKNKTFVNGQEIDRYALIPGTEIQIGDTRLFFQLEIFETPQYIQAPQSNDYQMSVPAAPPKSAKNFYIIVALIGLAFIGLMSLETEKLDDSIQFRNEESIAEEIAETFKRKQELETAYYSQGKDSKQYLEAEANYLRGFRDYREGNYNRAIAYFSAALSLYPQHELAERYLLQAKRKRDEEIQYSMSTANSLRDKAQYRQAMSHYRHVMVLINDTNDMIYKEAKALYDECQFKLKGGL